MPATATQTPRRIRVVVAKPGLDGTIEGPRSLPERCGMRAWR